MPVRTRGLNLILWLLLVGGMSVQAQVADFGSREDDERAATVEERNNLVADLVAKAGERRRAGDLATAAAFLNRAAWLQKRLHKPEEATTIFSDALDMLKQAPNSSARIDSLNGLAAIYADASQYDQSVAELTNSLRLSELTNYVNGQAEALLILSQCQDHSNHALALKTAQESLVLWQSINSKWGMAKTYVAMGDYQLSQNDLIAATDSYHTSLNLWTELNVPAERGESLIGLGFVEYRRGAWQSSLLWLSQGQALINENAEPDKMGQIAGTMAEAFIESGLPDIGLQKLTLATEYFRRAKSQRALVVMDWDMGKAHYLLGDYSAAVATLEKGVSSGRSLDEPVFAALCAEYLGRTYVALNDFGAALNNYQWALEQYRVSNPMEAARTRALIGQLYQRQGKIEPARKKYEEALGTFRRLEDHLNESATLFALGSLELQLNHLETAQNYLQQSLDVTENIRRVSTSNDLTTAFSATVQDRYEALIECLMRKNRREPGRGFDREALQINEMSRARSLNDFLRATQTGLAGNNPELAEKEKSLRQQLHVKEDSRVSLLAKDYKPEELEALEREIAGLDAEYKQTVAKIKSLDPAYEQITDVHAANLRQIQQIVNDDQTLLLEYMLGREKSYVWAVTNTTLASYELPPEGQITSATKKVYDLLKEAPHSNTTNGLDRAGRELANMILVPVAGELNRRRRIIVVADGALNYVPFQMLPGLSADGAPLISDYEIVNAPTASILGQLQIEAARRQRPSELLALFGDPVFASNYSQFSNGHENEQVSGAEDYQWRSALRDIDAEADSADPSKLKPLFFAREELANLRSVAGDQTFMATGFDASRERLKSTNLSRYAILHFATHGILDPKQPQKSGIVLSMIGRDGQPVDGFIGLEDIYALRAPVSLVVLSACRTGLGKDVRGEGLIGLTRGFMYAGASSVVASLWKVDDESTAELMKRFYLNMIQKEMKPAAALRAAQNTIRQEPQWSAPYYWAAFTLQGDYRGDIKSPTTNHESTRTVALIGTAVLVVLFALYLSNRRMRRALDVA